MSSVDSNRIAETYFAGVTLFGVAISSCGFAWMIASAFGTWWFMPDWATNAQWGFSEWSVTILLVLADLASVPIAIILGLLGAAFTLPGGMVWFSIWYGRWQNVRNRLWDSESRE